MLDAFTQTLTENVELCEINYDSQRRPWVSGLTSKMLRQIGHQLATVSWAQLLVGNDQKINQGQPPPRAFLKRKNSFLCHYVWNAASLFLLTLVGFKKS